MPNATSRLKPDGLNERPENNFASTVGFPFDSSHPVRIASYLFLDLSIDTDLEDCVCTLNLRAILYKLFQITEIIIIIYVIE